jgi:propionyl-CoA synthetase
VFDPNAGVYGRWFPERRLQHLLERGRPPCHGRPRHAAAIIYDSPVTGRKQTITYAACRPRPGARRHPAQLRRREGRPRHPLHADGAGGVVAMLACARIGAVHSVVFGGFAPKELATRIDDAKPK